MLLRKGDIIISKSSSQAVYCITEDTVEVIPHSNDFVCPPKHYCRLHVGIGKCEVVLCGSFVARMVTEEERRNVVNSADIMGMFTKHEWLRSLMVKNEVTLIEEEE